MRLIDADALIADLLTVDPRYTEMVEWCCNVIRQTPTIEPTDTDIISRADAIGCVDYWIDDDATDDAQARAVAIKNALRYMPSTDAVSRKDTVTLNSPISIQAKMVAVVRCKDCKHLKTMCEDEGTCYYWCKHWNNATDDWGHCYYGERREP